MDQWSECWTVNQRSWVQALLSDHLDLFHDSRVSSSGLNSESSTPVFTAGMFSPFYIHDLLHLLLFLETCSHGIYK